MRYDYSQPYVTKDEYLEVKGVNLDIELQADDNNSNKVNRFIQDLTNFVLDHLVMEYGCNELNRQTHDFEDLAEFRRVRFHYGMLDQIEYVLNNGLIQLNSGINMETGSITDFSAVVIGPAALRQFKLAGFCNKQEKPRCNGSLSPKDMPTIEELVLELGKKVDKVDGKGLSANDYSDSEKMKLKQVVTDLDGKVDKEAGKSLTSNDFTNAYKQKLDSVQENAQVNVIEKVCIDNEPLIVSGKTVNIPASAIGGDKEDKSNKVTALSDQSTDIQYPSAKCVYDNLMRVIEIAEGSTGSYTLSIVDNPSFNSEADSIGSITSFTDINGNVIPVSSLHNGDIILVIEIDVPDRWFSIADSKFYMLETRKVDLSDYVQKTSSANKVYGTDNNGDQATIDISVSASNDSVVKRSGTGQVKVAQNPVADEDATSKKYVDTGLGGKVDKVTGSSLVPDTKITAYDNHIVSTNNPHSVTKEQIGLGNVDNKSEATIKSDFTGSIANGNTGFATGGDVYAELRKVKNLIAIAWADLVDLRDNGELIPGTWYQITDYVTKTTQLDTRAMSNYFDIIVRADTETSLNENAYATPSSRDLNGYFGNSNLSAWKLKYCLDNDTSRFAWADEEDGKGVIYEMIDEFDNKLPYDFKNIQFKRYYVETDGTFDKDGDSVFSMFNYWATADYTPIGFDSESVDLSDYIWAYSFYATLDNRDASLNGIVNETDGYGNNAVYGNEIKPLYVFVEIDEEGFITPQSLNNIIFYYQVVDDETVYVGINNNSFDGGCHTMTFSKKCYGNKFGADCFSNTFGNGCSSNTFGNDCYSNTFGNDCYSNTFGNDCNSNTFGNGCYSNTFGNGCYSNTFGNDCFSNTFGNDCNSNTFGNDCYSNTLLANANNNGLDEKAYYNIFENGVSYVDLEATETYEDDSQNLQNVKVCQGVVGSYNNHIVITVERGNTFDTTVHKANSVDIVI